MKLTRFALLFFGLVFSINAFADHRIEDLEGKWYSTLWPDAQEFYVMDGIREVGNSYVFNTIRNMRAGGSCIGAGILNIISGSVNLVEVCPKADGGENTYYAAWRLVEEHEDHHLVGGYYIKGEAAFHEENLDKVPHH